MDAKAKVVPYEVGGWYRQQDGEWVQLVGIASPGSHYECMYSIDADGQRIHRYTNRPGDYGRVTGSAHDYSDPRNIPPTIPLTDHEAALAELQSRIDRVLRWCDAVQNHPNIAYNRELYETAGKVRTLASSATGEKNAEEETR